MMSNDSQADAKRWVQAPVSDAAVASAVLGVWLEPEEEVQWIWTTPADGSGGYVSGYQVTLRTDGA